MRRSIETLRLQGLLSAVFLLLGSFAETTEFPEEFIDSEGKLQLTYDFWDPETVETTCNPESIYVLTSQKLAQMADVPQCNPEELFVISAHSGQIFLKGSQEAELHNADRPHSAGAHSSPWYFAQAIKGSRYQAKDITNAGLVYVEDYCYYMWWLASAQSTNPSGLSPAIHIIKIYEALQESSLWRRYKGADFIFYLPFHLNLVSEYQAAISDRDSLHHFLHLICGPLKASLQITSENLQGRNMCGTGHMKGVVVPFVPNAMEEGRRLLAAEAAEGGGSDLKQRTSFLYFHGRCTHQARMNPSRVLRSHVVKAMEGQGDDIHAQCTEDVGRLPFKQVLQNMAKSVFCLVLPELGQSARVLSEAMLAGCIPVFIGPPFAAMPFHTDLVYSEFAITIFVETHHQWTAGNNDDHVKGVREVSLGEEALHAIEHTPVYSMLPNASAIVQTLREIPELVVETKLREVKAARTSFIFNADLSAEDKSAIELLTINLCRHMNSRLEMAP